MRMGANYFPGIGYHFGGLAGTGLRGLPPSRGGVSVANRSPRRSGVRGGSGLDEAAEPPVDLLHDPVRLRGGEGGGTPHPVGTAAVRGVARRPFVWWGKGCELLSDTFANPRPGGGSGGALGLGKKSTQWAVRGEGGNERPHWVWKSSTILRIPANHRGKAASSSSFTHLPRTVTPNTSPHAGTHVELALAGLAGALVVPLEEGVVHEGLQHPHQRLPVVPQHLGGGSIPPDTQHRGC